MLSRSTSTPDRSALPVAASSRHTELDHEQAHHFRTHIRQAVSPARPIANKITSTYAKDLVVLRHLPFPTKDEKEFLFLQPMTVSSDRATGRDLRVVDIIAGTLEILARG